MTPVANGAQGINVGTKTFKEAIEEALDAIGNHYG